MPHEGDPAADEVRRRLVGDLAGCAMFFTRLPLPASWGAHGATFTLARAAWALPLVGALVGVSGGIVLVAAALGGASPLVAGGLAILVLVLLTGGLHEDGLADCADALGGRTPERRLEIMRDSRVGTYGVLAVALSVLLRAASLADLAGSVGGLAAVSAVAGVGALSRTAALWPLHALPPARPDGLGAAALVPRRTAVRALASAALLGTLLLLPLGLATAIACLAVGALVVWWATRAARRLLGGQTGDVAGATIQAVEIAGLVVLAVLTRG